MLPIVLAMILLLLAATGKLWEVMVLIGAGAVCLAVCALVIDGWRFMRRWRNKPLNERPAEPNARSAGSAEPEKPIP